MPINVYGRQKVRNLTAIPFSRPFPGGSIGAASRSVIELAYVVAGSNFSRTISDSILLNDSRSKYFSRKLLDLCSSTDNTAKSTTLKIVSDILSYSDFYNRSFKKQISNNISTSDILLKLFTRGISDTIIIRDGAVRKIGKVLRDIESFSDSIHTTLAMPGRRKIAGIISTNRLTGTIIGRRGAFLDRLSPSKIIGRIS
jgi:hypothetical protein